MSHKPWRYRCPEGHAGIRFGANSVRCGTCGCRYDKDELVDLAASDHESRTAGTMEYLADD